MIFHRAGKYNGDESTLPQREHHPNAVPFKEPKSMLLLSIIANAGAFLMIVLMGIPVFLLGREYITRDSSIFLVLALWFPMLTIVPHEFLHALCFKKDVYYYTNFKQGMAFVVGTGVWMVTLFDISFVPQSCICGCVRHHLYRNGVWGLHQCI